MNKAYREVHTFKVLPDERVRVGGIAFESPDFLFSKRLMWGIAPPANYYLRDSDRYRWVITRRMKVLFVVCDFRLGLLDSANRQVHGFGRA